ncbi:hypothetical protein GUJ93_ZPchr0029g29032 [Zizania palustris]|uniref:Uncharacterized protein n=1 Tax=Zizania palustris TaxID=103762 RepID=A0A8J5QYW4_ZIZPA|nr:hypothetical protein GUJ93_ZPchr0029g29032 [Zizania palustris]
MGIETDEGRAAGGAYDKIMGMEALRKEGLEGGRSGAGEVYPETLTLLFSKGLLDWFLQVILIRVLLYMLGTGETPLLDIVAYAGYGFVGTSLAMLVRIF